MGKEEAETKDDKRKLCFDIPKAKINGTAAKANFIWARGGATLAKGTANKHKARGKFVLDLTDLEVSAEENDTTTTTTVNVTANGTTNGTANGKEEEEESLLDKTEVRIAGVFVVLLAVGAGYFFYTRQQKEAQAREAAMEAERARESKRGKKKKSRRSRRSRNSD